MLYLKIFLLILLFTVLLGQAIWIYRDAEKRGHNKWLWGLFGALNTPSNLIIYLIVTRAIISKNFCDSCGNRNRKTAKFCDNCGHELGNEERIY